MSDEEAAEVVALRRHFGVSAREYALEMPAWEVELLLGSLMEEGGYGPEAEAARASAPPGDPFEDVPEHLAAL